MNQKTALNLFQREGIKFVCWKGHDRALIKQPDGQDLLFSIKGSVVENQALLRQMKKPASAPPQD